LLSKKKKQLYIFDSLFHCMTLCDIYFDVKMRNQIYVITILYPLNFIFYYLWNEFEKWNV